MATQVGEAVIKLTFDGSDVKASLSKTQSDIENSGKKSGTAWGDAWTVAAGNLISRGISKIASVISSNMDNAIKRVDTLNNSQKVFTAMGYATDSVSKSMGTLNTYLDGLPTSMTNAVQGVQLLSASFGGIERGTEIFIDMNNAGLAFGATSAQISNAIMQLGQLPLDGPLDAQTWNSLRNSGFSPVFAAMAKEAGISVGELKEQFGGFGTKTVNDFLNELHKLGTEGGGDMESLSELARKNTDGIGTAFENVQNRIGKAIAKIIDHIGAPKIAGVINDISSHFADVADVIINILDGIVNYWPLISPILVGVMTFLTGLLALNFGQKVLTFLSLLAAHPVIALLGVIAAIIMVIAQNWDYLKEQVENGLKVIGDVLSTVGNFFVEQWNGICDGAKKAWDFITGLFSNLANFFGNIFSNAWTAVKNVFSTGGQIFMGIVDGITQAFRTIVNAIITGINHVVAIPFNAINGFLSFLKSIDILGIKPFDWVGTIDVPQIPLLAQGGYASGATGAVIGENGPEVVLPLQNNTDNWAGLLASTLAEEMSEQRVSGSGVTVYMTNEINNRLDAEEIGRIMIQSIRRAA